MKNGMYLYAILALLGLSMFFSSIGKIAKSKERKKQQEIIMLLCEASPECKKEMEK